MPPFTKSWSDQIKFCKKIDSVVGSFQGQLRSISEEVGNLQRQSEAFNVSLKNRQALEQSMHEYLQTILLPEELINDLCNDDIDADTPSYLKKVSQLEVMLRKTKGQIPESKALIEVKPELEKLKFKVCARSRNFLISKMNNLRKPKSNF